MNFWLHVFYVQALSKQFHCKTFAWMYLFNFLWLLKITTTRSAFWVALEALTWGYPSHNTGAFTVARWVTSGHGWEKENVIDAWFEFDDQCHVFGKILKSLQMLFKIYLYSVCTTEMCEVVTVILFVCRFRNEHVVFSCLKKSVNIWICWRETILVFLSETRTTTRSVDFLFFSLSVCMSVCISKWHQSSCHVVGRSHSLT